VDIGKAARSRGFVLIVWEMMLKLNNKESNHWNRREPFFIYEASVHMTVAVR
jgi:hypothetical protein